MVYSGDYFYLICYHDKYGDAANYRIDRILCTDSAECFDANKAYLIDRAEKESNPKVKALLKKDAAFLDSVQTELTSARRFMIAVRCKNMKDVQVFDYANRVRKIICDQGFDAHRMTKAEIKRLLALYFDAALYGEQMPDVDGANNFCLE